MQGQMGLVDGLVSVDGPVALQHACKQPGSFNKHNAGTLAGST